MSSVRNLTREDIEGQTIEAVLQTPYEFAPDGYGGCRVFIKMQKSVCFELVDLDIGSIAPVYQINEGDLNLIPAKFPEGVPSCQGETIKKVMRSDLWPTIGLLTSSNRYLHIHNWYDIHVVGPCLTDVGWFYKSEDVIPYWP